MIESIFNTFDLAICCVPLAFILGTGFYLISDHSRAPFSYMAGYLTLKPFVATPLFGLALGALDHPSVREDPSPLTLIASLCALALPGLGITLLLASGYRDVLASETRDRAVILLALDTLRWGSSVLLMWGSILPSEIVGDFFMIFLPFSLSMPFLFPIAALILTRLPKK